MASASCGERGAARLQGGGEYIMSKWRQSVQQSGSKVLWAKSQAPHHAGSRFCEQVVGAPSSVLLRPLTQAYLSEAHDEAWVGYCFKASS
eukprot:88062-Pelagomonas_calceolata.AAC.5